MNYPVALFDGVCNLCNRSVQFIIKHDQEKQFRFASLQGKAGQELLRKSGLPLNELNSFVLLEDDKFYTRSTAALRMLKRLGGRWKLFYVFIIIPPFIRNAIYDWVARNRYKWYGKREECMVPSPDLKERFLE